MTLDELVLRLNEVMLLPVSVLLDPEKRVYFSYLCSALIISFFVYHYTARKEGFFQYIFNKEVWWSKSSRIDYYYVLLNGAVKIFFLAPFIPLGLYWSQDVSDFLFRFLGHASFDGRSALFILLYTLVLVIVKDFFSFLIHFLMHKVPALWEFHKVHHSATSLNPFTQYRLHPIELIINNFTAIIAFSMVTGLFDYLSNGVVEMYKVLGVNAFLFLFKFTGANLRHSHVKLKYPSFLENILISPYQHQIHHSDNPSFFNKNMGAIFAIWDKLFGTLSKSKEINHISFGLTPEENKQLNVFYKSVSKPFLSFFKRLFRIK